MDNGGNGDRFFGGEEPKKNLWKVERKIVFKDEILKGGLQKTVLRLRAKGGQTPKR